MTDRSGRLAGKVALIIGAARGIGAGIAERFHEEGAFADLLVVDGDPTANIELIENPEKNFLIIMKDGKIFKDALHS